MLKSKRIYMALNLILKGILNLLVKREENSLVCDKRSLIRFDSHSPIVIIINIACTISDSTNDNINTPIKDPKLGLYKNMELNIKININIPISLIGFFIIII